MSMAFANPQKSRAGQWNVFCVECNLTWLDARWADDFDGAYEFSVKHNEDMHRMCTSCEGYGEFTLCPGWFCSHENDRCYPCRACGGMGTVSDPEDNLCGLCGMAAPAGPGLTACGRCA